MPSFLYRATDSAVLDRLGQWPPLVARPEFALRQPCLPAVLAFFLVVVVSKLFFGAQDTLVCATRTVGMKLRVKCSVVVLPTHFLNVISSTHRAQGVKQHPLLDKFMPMRNVISPSVTQQATAVELLTGSFQQRRRWQCLVAILHDGVARARARGRPRLTPGKRNVRGGCAADMATTTNIRDSPLRGHTTNECGFPQST
jgi:hypothetical protein